jgi:hypothetical protein
MSARSGRWRRDPKQFASCHKLTEYDLIAHIPRHTHGARGQQCKLRRAEKLKN